MSAIIFFSFFLHSVSKTMFWSRQTYIRQRVKSSERKEISCVLELQCCLMLVRRHTQSCIVSGVQNTSRWCCDHPSAVTLFDTHSRMLRLHIDLNVCSGVNLSVNKCESILWIVLDMFTFVIVDTFLRSDDAFMTAVWDIWKHSVKPSAALVVFPLLKSLHILTSPFHVN